MKLKTKIKKRIKQNFGVLLILGIITMLGVAALINIMLIKPYVDIGKIEHKPKITVLPINVNKGEIKTITAYSELDSCHYANCVMASGKRAYVGAVACPRNIKLGTKIYIDGFGELICEDKTALKFNGRYDIFMGYGEEAYKKAIAFGIKKLLVIN